MRIVYRFDNSEGEEEGDEEELDCQFEEGKILEILALR